MPTAPSTPELSIVLPAFNEGHRLIQSLNAIKSALESITPNYEIIIVDDGSLDNTVAVARGLTSENVILITYALNQGKGYAVRQGMQRARGKYHLFMDVDLATSLDAIKHFYHVMHADNADIIIGNRKSMPKGAKQSQPWTRRVLGYGFTLLSKIILNCPFNDFTCGFKMFKQQASAMLFKYQRINRWSFDAEILFLAHKYRFVVKEIPVAWQHRPFSKVRLSTDMLSSLKDLIQIRINNARHLYQ